MDLSSSSVFEWGTLGRPLTYLILEAAFFFTVTLCIDAYGRIGHAVTMPAGLRMLLLRWGLRHAEHFVFYSHRGRSYPRKQMQSSPLVIRASRIPAELSGCSAVMWQDLMQGSPNEGIGTAESQWQAR